MGFQIKLSNAGYNFTHWWFILGCQVMVKVSNQDLKARVGFQVRIWILNEFEASVGVSGKGFQNRTQGQG